MADNNDFSKEYYVEALKDVCERADSIEDAKEFYAKLYNNRKPSNVSEEEFEEHIKNTYAFYCILQEILPSCIHVTYEYHPSVPTLDYCGSHPAYKNMESRGYYNYNPLDTDARDQVISFGSYDGDPDTYEGFNNINMMKFCVNTPEDAIDAATEVRKILEDAFENGKKYHGCLMYDSNGIHNSWQEVEGTLYYEDRKKLGIEPYIKSFFDSEEYDEETNKIRAAFAKVFMRAFNIDNIECLDKYKSIDTTDTWLLSDIESTCFRDKINEKLKDVAKNSNIGKIGGITYFVVLNRDKREISICFYNFCFDTDKKYFEYVTEKY